MSVSMDLYAPPRRSDPGRRRPGHRPTRCDRFLPPWHSRLMSVCARAGRSHEDSEDLVQDAYVRFLEYRRRHAIQNEAGLLATIVRNLAINQYRRQRLVPMAPDVLPALDQDPLWCDDIPSADRALAAQERLEQVTRTLNRVSCRTCQIFLAHRSGYSYQEIAREFGISHRTIQKHISRATVLLGVRAPVSRF